MCIISNQPPHLSEMTQSELASLTLFPVTPAQAVKSIKQAWHEWGGLLAKEQYLERDAQTEVMEHAVNSRMVIWYGQSDLASM